MEVMVDANSHAGLVIMAPNSTEREYAGRVGGQMDKTNGTTATGKAENPT